VRAVLASLPLAHRLACIVVLFVAIVTSLVFLTQARLEVLSAIRAYVRGESLWSKGQKDAVHHLTRYADARNEADYRRYLAAIAVPLGDREARLSLEHGQGDAESVLRGFVRGRNDPEDVPHMTWLFHRFRRFEYMTTARDVWAAADHYLVKLARYGEELHGDHGHPPAGAARAAALKEKIAYLNRRLTPLEDAFSQALAEGARWFEGVLLTTTYVASVLLLLAGVLASRMLLGHIVTWETRYHHLLDTANDAFLVTDLETGQIVAANRKAEELTGRAIRELLGSTHVALVPMDERDAHRAFLDRCARRGGGTVGDVHVRHQDGRRIPVEISANVTDLGRRRVVQSFVRDVRERKRAEAALRQSEARWRAISALTSDWAYSYRRMPGGEVVLEWVTEAFTRMTGYTLAEAQARGGLLGLVHPEDVGLARAREESRLEGQPHTSAMRMVTKAGKVRWVLDHGVRIWDDPETDAVHFHGAVQDITERKLAEDALRDSEARKTAIVESALDGIVRMDAAGRIVEFNPAAERIFGYTRAELLGASLAETIVPPEYRTAHRVGVGRFLATGRSTMLGRRLEVIAMRKDGTQFPVEIAIATTPSGGRPMFTAFVRDISDRKRAQAEIEDARRRAEQQAAELAARARELTEARNAALEAARVKTEFLANMSHEIRTPMTAILGFTDLLSDPDAGDAERAVYVETVRRNGEHLQRILNDILDLSKIEAGKLVVERVVCSPIALVGEVASLLRPQAAGKGLTLAVECPAPVPASIRADPTRLRQILMNLVGNAIKFTETGGVRIRVRMTTPGEAAEPMLRFEVVDSGLGIPSELMTDLFSAFTQADASTTRRFGGTGLGLTISRRLAETLGGRVTAESVPGAGSTFVLMLPTGPLDGVPMLAHGDAAMALVPAAPGRAPIAERRLAGRVLLAEDAPDSRRLLSFYLRRAGIEVASAEDGAAAFDAARTALAAGRPFDVVLMDMQMPRVDGYDATARLRAAGYVRPIVALTAHAMESDREKCLAAGCDDFLTKPIDPDALVATLAAYLRPGADAPREAPEGPSLAEITETFVGGLPARADALEERLAAGDRVALATLAHRLKGTAGAFGFPALGTAAAVVEAAAKGDGALDVLAAEVRRIAALCREAASGAPGDGAAA
jgi:PAS domain S-box-containing protein